MKKKQWKMCVLHRQVIAMSANAFDEDVKRFIASGMNSHLSKPVNVSLIKETLASILGGYFRVLVKII